MDSDFNWTIHFSDSCWCAEVVFPQWRCYGVSSGYQNPPACLPGGVCSEGAAGCVFCGVVDCVVGFSRLLFRVCVALLRALWWMSRRGFPFASWGHEFALCGVCGTVWLWLLGVLLHEGLLVAAFDSTAPAAWTLGHIFLTLGCVFSDTMVVYDVCYCIVFCFCCLCFDL